MPPGNSRLDPVVSILYAIDESGVCEGPGWAMEIRQMAQCLRELGFVQERNATRSPGFSRTRKWRWPGTGDTGAPRKPVSTLPRQGFELTGTQHSRFGNCAELCLKVFRSTWISAVLVCRPKDPFVAMQDAIA